MDKFRNAVAVATAISIFVFTGSTFAKPKIPTTISESGCASIKKIGEQLKMLTVRRDAVAIGNKARWCPLSKQQIDYGDEMIKIFESDPERCGVRDSVVDNLKSSQEKLRETTSTACGV
jgi:hypothetical protein